ncbi:MAG: hypothetical protein M3O78_06640 [Chloroflexota bacterium]|nr:hypothetical protein [Chloroflexota bacterium]
MTEYRRPRPARDIPHLLVPEKRRISHWNDRNELRVNNWIEPWDFASPLEVGIINVPFSKTSILPNRAYAAPNALRDRRNDDWHGYDTSPIRD